MSIASKALRKAVSSIEIMESRLMMSVVNVSASGGDDTHAVQNAINNADTVHLNPGTYHISQTLNLRSGSTLQGDGNATLAWTGGGNSYLGNSQGGATVTGVGITGAGLQVDGSNNRIVNNNFHDMYGRSIDFMGGITNSTINNNAFTNIDGDATILGWQAQNTHFDNNKFEYVHEGIHCFWGGQRNGWDNVSIQHNSLQHV